MTKAANRQLRFLRVFIRGSSNLYTADRRTRATVCRGLQHKNAVHTQSVRNICTTFDLYKGDKTRKTYKICSRHTIRNLRNAPVQLSWERNLQMAATFPSSSPGNTRPIPLLPNILTTCPKSPLLPNILTTYPIHSQTNYYCPIYSRATQALPNISTAAQFTRHLH